MSEQVSEVSETNEPAAVTAVAESVPEGPYRMTLTVQITDAGPCRKHVHVEVPREDIEHYFEESMFEFERGAAVPGFRAGHVPRALIQKRYKKEVENQVRQRVLMQSLQQLGEDHNLEAINEPELDVDALVIPETGPFSYEFDVEVRPEFDLPNYSGLKIERPTRAISDEDVEKYFQRYIAQFGQLVPHDGPAELRDSLLVNVTFESNGEELSHADEVAVRVLPVLRFADAEIADFDKLMVGARVGDRREAQTKISLEASKAELRGEPVTVKFEVTDVKRLRLPELNSELFEKIEVESEEELRKEIREVLERQVTYEQRQSTREQVLKQITESATWDLPESMVQRQVENALYREVLEMQQAGFTDSQIEARKNQLLQSRISMTRQALKEHFVLDKIATAESIEVTALDKEIEISYMAMQRGESPRRVRARLEKTGLIENLDAQIRERKAVDFVLSKAEFVDVPSKADKEEDVEAIPLSVSGYSATAVEEPAAADDAE
jgi:trigger factor